MMPTPECFREAFTDRALHDDADRPSLADAYDDTPVVDHGYHDERVPGCPLCSSPMFEVVGASIYRYETDELEVLP